MLSRQSFKKIGDYLEVVKKIVQDPFLDVYNFHLQANYKTLASQEEDLRLNAAYRIENIHNIAFFELLLNLKKCVSN